MSRMKRERPQGETKVIDDIASVVHCDPRAIELEGLASVKG